MDTTGADDIARLRLDDATPLARALGAMIADSLSIRLLSIKGPAADHHALRAPRVAADADLLVDPRAFHAFCSALEAHGWRERVARTTPSVLERHSRTYIHGDWPCDIDVHERFPGFFAAPEDVFEELWARREALSIGNVAVFIPSLPASAMIAALHALRNMSDPRHRDEWETVIGILSGRLTGEQRRDFLELAAAGRARSVLRDATTALGVDTVDDLDAEEAEIWAAHVRFGPDGGTAGWIRAMRHGTLPERARLLARAVWVPRDLIPRNEAAERLPAARVVRYQARRWRRGLRAVVRYLRQRSR